MHTVLSSRAANPEMRSAQMAVELSARLGREVSADWVRKWLHAAREKFAELLLAEVCASLRDPNPDSVEQELIDLELYQYCKMAVDRWRQERS
jgi:RNA polymerase sigma-70 factor (ECF subfamily)